MEFKESKVKTIFLGCEKNHMSEMKLTIMNAILCNSIQFKYISQKFKRNWATGTITKRNWVLWPWPVSSIFQPGWTWPAWCGSNRSAEQGMLVGHLSLAETEQIEGDFLAEDNGCNHLHFLWQFAPITYVAFCSDASYIQDSDPYDMMVMIC